MDGSREQVNMDASILHDMVEDYKEGHVYDENGIVIYNMKAQMALVALVEYINDLLEDDGQEMA